MNGAGRSVSVTSARVIYSTAVAAGVRMEDLLACVGLPSDLLQQPGARIPYETSKRLWNVAGRLSGDECFGLHAAERLRPEYFGAFGYAVRTCVSGREAVERMVRYGNSFFPDIDFALEIEGPLARFTHAFRDGPEDNVPASQFIVAAFVVLSREFTGVDLTPRAVGLTQAPPRRDDEYRRLFRAPVRFREPTNAVIFDRALLDLPLLGSNPDLQHVLDRFVEEYLRRLPRFPELTGRVHRMVAHALQSGGESVEAAARKLRLSPRTLQRRLRDEGTSYRRIVEVVRRELAERYLRQPELSIDQVADRLGFSEPSAFHRAFRRHTGVTPAAYRGQLGADLRR